MGWFCGTTCWVSYTRTRENALEWHEEGCVNGILDAITVRTNSIIENHLAMSKSSTSRHGRHKRDTLENYMAK